MTPDLSEARHIHLVGAGGAGMGAIASGAGGSRLLASGAGPTAHVPGRTSVSVKRPSSSVTVSASGVM